MMPTLTNGRMLSGFRVEAFLKSARPGEESYRATAPDGTEALLTLYDPDRLPSRLLREGLLPVEHLCDRPDTAAAFHLLGRGTCEGDGHACRYVVRARVEGRRLSDFLSGGGRLDWEEATRVVHGIGSLLALLHRQEPPLIHNDVTPRNVLLTPDSSAALIGLGHLSSRTPGAPAFDTSDLNPWYRAPETYKGLYDEQSDVFALGALLYEMLFGQAPWQAAFPDDCHAPAARRQWVREARRAELDLGDGSPVPAPYVPVLQKALCFDCGSRFAGVSAFCRALGGEPAADGGASQAVPVTRVAPVPATDKPAPRPRTGGGLADVAGMDGVKSAFRRDVLFVLQHPDVAAKYRLRMPNGALLYGPPGCGKTFFAEKFAEESGLNFSLVKASDLGSIYIHGTQGKIAELFAEAEELGPSVLCFDELDAMVPDRSRTTSDELAGEVNEFLSQLNNCADRGIFVIGTSNRPERIDPAVLRTGRIDRLVYIPLPDFEARRALFELSLRGRFCDDTIDCGELARLTEGCTCSDIARLADDAALTAAMDEVPISQGIVRGGLEGMRRSVTAGRLLEYDRLRRRFEEGMGAEAARRPVGFAAY